MNPKRIILLTLIAIISFSATAQRKIAGKVLDARTGEELIGVNVVLEGTKIGASTDLDGNFIIENVPANATAVIASYISYETQRVLVKWVGTEAMLTIKLKESTLMLEGATVTTEKITNTESALVLETKKAKQVVSGISRQQIAKSQDNNAAQAMARIPGVTIVENRFVMIRGVSERYNSIMINNVMAPSTEVDKRTFSFDLISSSVLDRMMIYKSGAPELPGDFAGGVIKIYTSSTVEENFTDINFSVGFRQNTTFSPYFQSQGSPTDFLGFDNGFRTLPSNFPTTAVYQNTNRADPLRQEAGRTLSNNFVAVERVATPDFNVGATFGRKFDLKGKKLTMLTSVGLSESFQTFQRDFFRYLEWEDRTVPVEQRFAFLDDTYQRDNKVSILSNWTYEYNSKNRFRFSNFFNQIGENETIIRNGKDFLQRPTDQLRNYLMGYRSRTIYSGQLEGDHTLSDKNELHWVVGGSYLGENEPDLRRFRTFRAESEADEVGFTMQLPPSSNLFETGRYFGSLNEFSLNHGLDFLRTLKEGLTSNLEIKAGYYTDFRQRQFDSRYFSYLYPGFFDPNIGDSLSQLPLDIVFDSSNIKSRDGFVVEEGTRPIDSYRASNFLNAAYFGANIPLGLWNVSGGVRYEYNIQVMESRDDASIISVRNPVGNLLPFANGSYNINEKNLVRMSYGRTVNRPEFRELAPFLFYDYKLEAGRIGNPNLETAVIDNIDLRYEFYPRFGETVSIGAFFKYFDSPIENRTIITTEQPNFTYINADYAINYGLELEVRKSLKGIAPNTFIEKLGLNANASYIFSEVDLGEVAVAQQRTRPLQGQSPYIVNAGLFYSNEDHKLDATLNYNVFGPRIFSVGDVLFPTIFELQRHSLDLTISKEFKGGIALKVGVQDLLNYPFRFFQDTDRTETATDQDDPIFTFRRGSVVTFSFRIKI